MYVDRDIFCFEVARESAEFAHFVETKVNILFKLIADRKLITNIFYKNYKIIKVISMPLLDRD